MPHRASPIRSRHAIIVRIPEGTDSGLILPDDDPFEKTAAAYSVVLFHSAIGYHKASLSFFTSKVKAWVLKVPQA